MCVADALKSVHSKGDLEIKRFVDGEYAWAMTHAMMVAYVRAENLTISLSLESVFEKKSVIVIHLGEKPLQVIK